MAKKLVKGFIFLQVLFLCACSNHKEVRPGNDTVTSTQEINSVIEIENDDLLHEPQTAFITVNNTVGVIYNNKKFNKIYEISNSNKIPNLDDFNGAYIGFNDKREAIPIIGEVKKFDEFVRIHNYDTEGNRIRNLKLCFKCEWDLQPNEISVVFDSKDTEKIIKEKLELHDLKNTPVVIKEILECDLNSDGQKELIIQATNVIENDLGQSNLVVESPMNIDIGIYNIIIVKSFDSIFTLYEMYEPIDETYFDINTPDELKEYIEKNQMNFELGDMYCQYTNEYYRNGDYIFNDEPVTAFIKENVLINIPNFDIYAAHGGTMLANSKCHREGLSIFNIIDINNDGNMEVILSGKQNAELFDIGYYDIYSIYSFDGKNIDMVLDISEDYVSD